MQGDLGQKPVLCARLLRSQPAVGAHFLFILEMEPEPLLCVRPCTGTQDPRRGQQCGPCRRGSWFYSWAS